MRLLMFLFISYVVMFAADESPGKLAIVDVPEHGVRLHQTGEPEFQAAADNLLNPVLRQKLRQVTDYAVVLRNYSPKTIVGYSVSWLIRDKAGTRRTVDTAAVAPGAFLDGKKLRVDPIKEGYTVVARGRARLLLPEINIGPEPVPPQVPDDVHIARLYTGFREADKVSVRLDAVIFEDGGFVGIDTEHLISEVQQTVDGQYDVDSTIITEQEAGASIDEIIEKVKAMLPAGGNDSASDTRARIRALFAEEFLRNVRTIGSDMALKIVIRRAYRNKPTLHRMSRDAQQGDSR